MQASSSGPKYIYIKVHGHLLVQTNAVLNRLEMVLIVLVFSPHKPLRVVVSWSNMKQNSRSLLPIFLLQTFDPLVSGFGRTSSTQERSFYLSVAIRIITDDGYHIWRLQRLELDLYDGYLRP